MGIEVVITGLIRNHSKSDEVIGTKNRSNPYGYWVFTIK